MWGDPAATRAGGFVSAVGPRGYGDDSDYPVPNEVGMRTKGAALDSRTRQMGLVLTIVAVVLVLISQATNLPGWVIVVLFVIAAVVAAFAYPGGGGSDS